MKRIFLIIMAAAVALPTLNAQSRKSITIGEVAMDKADGKVTVAFGLAAGDRAVKNSQTLYITPVLRNGSQEYKLPAVAVAGKRAGITTTRYGEGEVAEPLYAIRRGGSVDYRTEFPYMEWMEGGRLEFDGVNAGCCSAEKVGLGLLADNILKGEGERRVEVVERIVTPTIALSTGGALATQFPFVASSADPETAAELENLADYRTRSGRSRAEVDALRQQMERFIDRNREGSVTVHFRQGSRFVDRAYLGNEKSLADLISVVRAIVESGDSKISRIVIAGFSSPEGSPSVNERLARNRAASLRDFIKANSPVSAELIDIYDGSIDWQGLRELVAEGDMKEKQQLLDIIDNTPIWDAVRNTGRHGQLMRLGSGNPYRYMQREYFPYLRQAALIKIFFEDK